MADINDETNVNNTDLSTIQSGDILFSRGEGYLGWHIRHASAAYYAHCEVLHELIETYPNNAQRWKVASSVFHFNPKKSGLRWRERLIPPREANTPTQFLILRTWRNEAEQAELLLASKRLVAAKLRYGLDSIVAIAIRGIGIKWRPWFSKGSIICSEAVMVSICASRLDIMNELSLPPRYIWPGLARETLAEIEDVARIGLP